MKAIVRLGKKRCLPSVLSFFCNAVILYGFFVVRYLRYYFFFYCFFKNKWQRALLTVSV